MEQLNPSDLKSILHSKRANLYYLEHCRVLVNGGRVPVGDDEFLVWRKMAYVQLQALPREAA